LDRQGTGRLQPGGLHGEQPVPDNVGVRRVQIWIPRQRRDDRPVRSSARVRTSPSARRLVALRGRIEVVIPRTGGSPPDASHPASRRRGSVELRAGARLPDGGSRPADRVPSRAHERGHPDHPGPAT